MARHTRAKKHTHKYYKRPDGMWACALPDCTHFMPTNMLPAPLGHYTICHGCGDKMILSSTRMEHKEPKCDDCSPITELGDFTEKLMEEKLRALGVTPKPDPYAVFKSQVIKKPITEKVVMKELEEPDQIEVIEPDDVE